MAFIWKLGFFFVFYAIVCSQELYETDDSNYCCDVKIEKISIDVVKAKPVKKSKYEEKEVVVGYKDCGIVGQNVCPIYDYVWDEVVYYTMEDVVEKDEYTMPCPSEHVVCCEGYEMYHDNCYKPEEIESLKKLEDLGILGFARNPKKP